MSSADLRISTPLAPGRANSAPKRLGWYDRLEAALSKLSNRNRFWHRVCSLIWLPYAFRSGISLRGVFRGDRESKSCPKARFSAVLPFRRFNRNWYNAMAGAALLGNSEVAGGSYVFAECGGEYTVVCKEMNYKFVRPCLGPAIYRVVDGEDLHQKLSIGGEFNVALVMEIYQQLHRPGKELLVGRCNIIFHCTPKAMVRERSERRKQRHLRRNQVTKKQAPKPSDDDSAPDTTTP